MSLEQQVAIVTGGATGIGSEIVRSLARQGMIVVINYNSSASSAQALQEELKKEGHQVDIVQANISNFDQAAALVDYAMNNYKRLDVLVNNAGITADNLILRMSEDDFDRVIDVNLKGTWNCCKHATKVMAKQRSGKIINISSVSGVAGNAGQTNYSASKAGIIGLTKALAREVAKRGITVNAVAPGFIQTKMTESLSSELVEAIAATIPMARLGEAKEVANVVEFLASPKADYITGQVIHVDGGMVM